MKKKIILAIIFLFGLIKVEGQVKLAEQPKCGCPTLNLYVHDTQLDFSKDSAIEGNSYEKAKKSGDYLKNDYAKQQSDQLKIFRGTKIGTINKVDFKSHAEIKRSGNPGNYSYSINVIITDPFTKATVAKVAQTTASLANTNAMIDSCMATFSPVLEHTIRKYQKKIRKESNSTKWIGLQWKAKPDSKKIGIKGVATFTITVTDCAGKLPVPNLPILIASSDPNTGIFMERKIVTNDSGKASVLFTGLHKGEAMMLPGFSFTSVNGKTMKDPIVCDDRKITVNENILYKITIDAKQTVFAAGQDIRLHGECVAQLKALPDGTFMLEPIDKTRDMHVTVESGIFTAQEGNSEKLVAPFNYTFPFLFTINKMDKGHTSGHGSLLLNYISPQKGQVVWHIEGSGKIITETIDIDKGTITYNPGQTLLVGSSGDTAKNAIALSVMTNLNVVSNYAATNVGKTIENINQNIASEKEMMETGKRIQQHENDPAYFKTVQGKADGKRAMSFNQQVGGNFSNMSEQTRKMDAEIDRKIKNNPHYVGSNEFKKDLGKEKMLREADEELSGHTSMAKVLPGTGSIKIEDSFKPKSSEPFSKNLKGTVGNLNVEIKVKVEKLDD